jgi:hypothetical protein
MYILIWGSSRWSFFLSFVNRGGDGRARELTVDCEHNRALSDKSVLHGSAETQKKFLQERQFNVRR